MSSLKSTIEALSAEFAQNLIAAIKSASLQEILNETVGASSSAPARRGRPPASASKSASLPAAAPARAARKGKGGRLARRSPEDLAKAKSEIISLLAKHPKGLRSEQIREKLGLSKQEVPRPLADALAEKLITKKGEKRATTYFKK
jgi:uncharacterized membrane protein